MKKLKTLGPWELHFFRITKKCQDEKNENQQFDKFSFCKLFLEEDWNPFWEP